MNRSVFHSFHSIIIRKICADLANATCYLYPYPPCRGFVIFAGDVNAAAECDLDVFREIANPPEI
jgi:hypothetical protein